MDHAPLLLFAQRQNNAGAEAAGNVCGGIMQLIFLAFYIYYLVVMYQTFNKISPENRDMEPGMVFLGLIPCFNIVWYFFIVTRLATSLEKEFSDRRLSGDGDFGKSVGITGGVFLCICCGLGWIVCGIIHLVKVNGYSKMLDEGGGGRRRGRDDDDDDDDDDDRPRRRRRPRDDDDDDDDDRPRSKRRGKDDDDDDDERPSGIRRSRNRDD